MSKNLNAAEGKKFASEVKHAYQGMQKLRKHTRTKYKIKAGAYQFNKMGKGLATPHTTQADLQPMNINHAPVVCTVTDWDAPEYTDIFDAAKTDIDERKELATTLAGAIGRRDDQIIIDALIAAGATKTVAESIGGVDTDLNVAKLKRVVRLYNDDEVDVEDSDIVFLGGSYGKESLLGATEVTSTDYASVKALVQGKVDEFLGMKFEWFGNRAEGGLPKAGNLRSNFVYERNSMGSVNVLEKNEVNYIAQKTSWLAYQGYSGGAVAIDLDGIVEVTSYET